MTLFSLLEDEVGPGMVNTYESCVIHKGHNPFSNQTGLSNICHVFNNEECSHCKWEKTTNDSQFCQSTLSFFQ